MDPVQCLTPFATSRIPRLLIGVSGGGDSIALLRAASEARSRFPTLPPFEAITVDHALRAESADEARFVRRTCEVLGVPHRTVKVATGAPTTGIQAWARNERLNAFRRAAEEQPGTVVLTAHTSDDSAETSSMRLRRAVYPAQFGLIGMAPFVWLHGGWLYRPFLPLSRCSLRDYLRSAEQRWIDDPSNFDQRFERSVVRGQLEENRQIKRNLLKFGSKEAAERTRLGIEAAQVIEEHFRSSGDHGFAVSLSPTEIVDNPACLLALRAVCGHVGGHVNLPTAAKVGTALKGLLDRDGAVGAARCLFRARGQRLTVEREHRRGGPPVHAPELHPWPTLVPAHDLALANALYGSLGFPNIPEPPVG